MIFSFGYLATLIFLGVDVKRDGSKNRAEEWFFLYERGKELGREELEKENEKLKAENQAQSDRINHLKGLRDDVAELEEEVEKLKAENETPVDITITWTPEQFERMFEKLTALIFKKNQVEPEEFYLKAASNSDGYEFGMKGKVKEQQEDE